jgi:hypothetical protein
MSNEKRFVGEVIRFGADGTKVVWFSELTEQFISSANLSAEDKESFFEQLNDAVMEVCDIWGVGL